jgi:glutamate-5-semialdehyde dehydrogenase
MSELRDYTNEIAIKANAAKKEIRILKTSTKNAVLKTLIENLRKNSKEIILENEKDLIDAKKKELSAALVDRLLLNESRIENLIKSLLEIISLPDPIGEVVRGINLANGLELATKRVPLGAILVIYESRPNVTIDVGALAFKSGNVAILRGGSEAIHSNKILVQIFRESLKQNNITEDALILVDKTDRSHIVSLLKEDKFIDLVVPRGGEALINFVSENSRIPVVKHDKGVCNLFVDKTADIEKSIKIILNAKIQRPGVCNAVENILIHKEFPHTELLLKSLKENKVELLLDESLQKFIPESELATESDYALEFLDNRLSFKTVNDLEEVIAFIEEFSSGHTEAILSEDHKTIEDFLHRVDSAAVFVNCSTRFHDGGEFGLGAEVGISTGKLHVRGPMGLVHLTTTKTILRGDGQIRN